MLKELYLDLETNGLDPKRHSPFQHSGIISIDGEEKERFDFKCRPINPEATHPKALEVTGITMQELLSYPDPKEVVKQWVNLLNKYVDPGKWTDKFILIGYNSVFDYDMMDSFMRKHKFGDFMKNYFEWHRVDVMSVLFTLQKQGILPPTKNRKLETMKELFGFEGDSHDAAIDIDHTKRMYDWTMSAIRPVGDIPLNSLEKNSELYHYIMNQTDN